MGVAEQRLRATLDVFPRGVGDEVGDDAVQVAQRCVVEVAEVVERLVDGSLAALPGAEGSAMCGIRARFIHLDRPFWKPTWSCLVPPPWAPVTVLIEWLSFLLLCSLGIPIDFFDFHLLILEAPRGPMGARQKLQCPARLAFDFRFSSSVLEGTP